MMKSLFRMIFSVLIFLYRLTSGRIGGRMQGLQVLLLTTKGRRTGRDRTVGLGTFEQDEAYVVVASNAGADVHPGWFFNLRSEPHVSISLVTASWRPKRASWRGRNAPECGRSWCRWRRIRALRDEHQEGYPPGRTASDGVMCREMVRPQTPAKAGGYTEAVQPEVLV